MKPSSFLEVLRQATAADPRVMRDAARLWRRWEKAGAPPASWTIRWNERALALFGEAVGLEVMRLSPTGGRIVALASLCHKVGGADSVLAAITALSGASDAPPRFSVPVGELRDLLSKASSDRARRWLSSLIDGAAASTFRGGREEVMHVARALDIIDRLEGREVHCSDLGSRAGASSKFFRPGTSGRRLLADALIALNGAGPATDQARELALEDAGIRLSPTAYAVLVAGPLTVGEPPLDFPWTLSARNEATLLTLQNLKSVRLLAACEGVLTVENEASFLGAMKEGLHTRCLLVDTGGFPNRAVLALLDQVMASAGYWRHWGDTDLAGIRIARLLESRVRRRPDMFRCGAAEVRRLKERLIPLPLESRREMAADLKAFPAALGVDVLRADLAEGGWLEQEAWEAPKPSPTPSSDPSARQS